LKKLINFQAKFTVKIIKKFWIGDFKLFFFKIFPFFSSVPYFYRGAALLRIILSIILIHSLPFLSHDDGEKFLFLYSTSIIPLILTHIREVGESFNVRRAKIYFPLRRINNNLTSSFARHFSLLNK
jgi:hypothetical protein